MTKQIIYSTIAQQISDLESKGLVFEDKNFAENQFNTYGYYNIINSYKMSYIIPGSTPKRYQPGTTFEQIFSLFQLDHNLRNAVMAAMLDFEEHLRAVVADVIANAYGTDHNIYLKNTNYRNRKATNPRFSLGNILKKLHENVASDKDPIKYYRTTYGVVPPWILFKGTYFSTLVNLVKMTKDSEKRKIIAHMYGIDESQVTKPIKDLFSQTLFLCLEYRNLSAHGGRIYNYVPTAGFSLKYHPDYALLAPTLTDLNTSGGLSRLLILLDAFSYNNPSEHIKKTITLEINRHLNQYPQDKNIVENGIDINIIFRPPVKPTLRKRLLLKIQDWLIK